MMRPFISHCLLVFVLGMLAVLATPTPAPSQVAVGVSISIAPPDLPVYEQPLCPGEDYIWTPGYWSWDGDDYFWVPGTWIVAPEPGFLWTPGYWAWGERGYVFTAGYWGPVVGFYGGVNYGFGYFGHGFEGGRWQEGHFYYNRAVANVNVTIIHNTYNTRVTNITETRVSFNGGNGGVQARATAQEEAAARERHVPPVAAQTQHVEQARANRELRSQVNHGAPPVAASQKPGTFSGAGVTQTTRAGAVHTAEQRNGNNSAHPENNAARSENNAAARPNNAAARPNPVHPNEMPAYEKPAPANTGNAKQDKQYQQEQNKLAAQQNQERQKLQQQQEKEHQQLAKQKADDARKAQVEQQHQQQTQVLQQQHAQQTQQMQQRQQSAQQHAAQQKPQKPEKPEKP